MAVYILFIVLHIKLVTVPKYVVSLAIKLKQTIFMLSICFLIQKMFICREEQQNPEKACTQNQTDLYRLPFLKLEH